MGDKEQVNQVFSYNRDLFRKKRRGFFLKVFTNICFTCCYLLSLAFMRSGMFDKYILL